ncbi:MAG: uracil-DNA glycosylase [Burkholderiaceae bacterium]
MTDLVADRLTTWNPGDWPVAQDWRELVAQFFASEAGLGLGSFIGSRLAAGATIYPVQPLHAMALTALSDVKVVILGQDPYHGPGQAQGLAFSVAPGVRVPPSLRNIRSEIERERRAGELMLPAAPNRQMPGIHLPDGDLTPWASQGVLLLNACMTVEQAKPGAHAKAGWEALTDRILSAVEGNPGPVVYMLWGAQAQSRRPAVSAKAAASPRLHLLANHPSPLSALRKPLPFMGCGHFAQANGFLLQHGAIPIDW